MTNAQRHIHPDDTSELLSSYLDDAVDVVERRRVDTLLRECTACAAELQDLRELRTLLRSLPAPMPKRSFTLDASVPGPRPRLFPIFRFASLAAALLLVMVLGVDAFGRAGQQDLPTAATFAEPAPAAEAQRGMEEQPQAAGGAMDEPAPEAGIMVAPETPEEAPALEVAPEEAPALETAPDAANPPAEGADDQAMAAEAAPAEADAQEQPAAEGAEELAPPPASLAQEQPADDPAASAALKSNEAAGADTTTLDDAQTLAVEPAGTALDGWRIAQILLAALVVGLGAATWWTARHQL
jgi:hypothetical protein